MNILFLTDSLDYVNGVTSHLYYLLTNLSKESSVNIILVCSGGNAVSKFSEKKISMLIENNISHNNRNTFNYGSAVLSIRKIIKSNKIDIVHSHNHYAANIGKAASKYLNAATIQTNHGIIPEEGKLKHLSADTYIGVNDSIIKYFKEVYSNTDNISLIYNGIDFYNREINKSSEPVKIIAASRFENSKGLDTFIAAVSKLTVNVKENTEFIIAGEGSMENELKLLDKKLNTKINFIGSQNNLRNIFDETSVFVFPSNSDSEGMPMTIIEAAASKNLIISSDFKGFENIFIPEEDAFIFKRNNPDDLADKLKFAISNPVISERLIANFYAKAKIKYNSELMAEKHFKIYRNLINSKK